MPFQFQQFAVDDSHCAMKVGTDGIVLGSWSRVSDEARDVLDIGTGSGLLALMLAQRFDSISVHAIEIDEAAAETAAQNFAASPWASRLTAEHISLQDFVGRQVRFDAIVCNPPFFDDSMRPRLLGRRNARHQDTLTTNQLFQSARRLLQPSGMISMIVPATQAEKIVQAAAEVGFVANRKATISTLPGRPPSRILFEFGDEAVQDETAAETTEHLVLEQVHHQRSPAYAKLAADFFLKP